MEIRDRAATVMQSLVASPAPVVEPAYYLHPDVLRMPTDPRITFTARQPETEPLPKRTIVRPELKRKIGFDKNGFRPKD